MPRIRGQADPDLVDGVDGALKNKYREQQNRIFDHTILFNSALSRTKWVAKGLVHERMCSNVRFPFDVILLSLADPLVEVRRVIPAGPLRGELVAAKLTRIITPWQFSSPARFAASLSSL